MADYFTTAGWIPILFPGGCWARRQLHACIRYVPTRSILMELQAGDLENSMADYFTTAGRIPIMFFWRLLGSPPATRQYKAHPYAINIHEVTMPRRVIVGGVPGAQGSHECDACI